MVPVYSRRKIISSVYRRFRRGHQVRKSAPVPVPAGQDEVHPLTLGMLLFFVIAWLISMARTTGPLLGS